MAVCVCCLFVAQQDTHAACVCAGWLLTRQDLHHLLWFKLRSAGWQTLRSHTVHCVGLCVNVLCRAVCQCFVGLYCYQRLLMQSGSRMRMHQTDTHPLVRGSLLASHTDKEAGSRQLSEVTCWNARSTHTGKHACCQQPSTHMGSGSVINVNQAKVQVSENSRRKSSRGGSKSVHPPPTHTCLSTATHKRHPDEATHANTCLHCPGACPLPSCTQQLPPSCPQLTEDAGPSGSKHRGHGPETGRQERLSVITTHADAATDASKSHGHRSTPHKQAPTARQTACCLNMQQAQWD